jgi:hypothetical protein
MGARPTTPIQPYYGRVELQDDGETDARDVVELIRDFAEKGVLMVTGPG